MGFEFSYYNVEEGAIGPGLVELAKDYLNSAARKINNGDMSFAEQIMTEGYLPVIQIAKRRGVPGLEKIEEDAERINVVLSDRILEDADKR